MQHEIRKVGDYLIFLGESNCIQMIINLLFAIAIITLSFKISNISTELTGLRNIITELNNIINALLHHK